MTIFMKNVGDFGIPIIYNVFSVKKYLSIGVQIIQILRYLIDVFISSLVCGFYFKLYLFNFVCIQHNAKISDIFVSIIYFDIKLRSVSHSILNLGSYLWHYENSVKSDATSWHSSSAILLNTENFLKCRKENKSCIACFISFHFIST